MTEQIPRESSRAWDSVFSVGREGTSSIVIGNRKLQEFLSDNFYFSLASRDTNLLRAKGEDEEKRGLT